MLYTFALLFVVALLFGLCRTEERFMDLEQDYWLQNHERLDEIQWGWSY